ncbi:BsuPI-related putative proteinase inhibitor [Fervidibacillus halotolerans]|uniref:Intracellular proteinase inhibitor BsuPI domain-containing protein n=1 Tax=Fervidibacillus halotolerans TaxID=2980027 RepID=A0A9E8LZC7_9BACI|nr:BsuPI-related putative proteinase inhibitor [Fervidibacillus halotolerans]WAA12492.1 BsuPI-related putative proteinase inhibitor [Fervidibacillus halotolerans]
MRKNGKKEKAFVLMSLIAILMFIGSKNFIPDLVGAFALKKGEIMEGNEDDMDKHLLKRRVDELKFQRKGVNQGEDGESERLIPNLSVRVEDGKMLIDFTLENVSDQTIVLSFSSGQKYDFWIYNDQNNLLYQWSEGKMFTMALETIPLQPNERLVFNESWDFIGRNGKKVNEKGVFQIVFQITGTIEGEGKINVNREDLKDSISIDTRENTNDEKNH